MSRESLTLTVQPNGDLLIAASNDCRAWLKRAREKSHYCDVAALYELTEPYWTNGSFAPFDAGEGNPFVGLTSAPCIAEDMDYPDDGKREVLGRLWYFPDYMLRSPVDELIRRGRVIFKRAPGWGDISTTHLGFDLSTSTRVRCSQCEALVINGTPTHERGCPNATHECAGCNARVPMNCKYCEECQS